MGFVALMRPSVCLAAAGATLAGLFALGALESRPLSSGLTMLSVFLLMAFADAFNDYFDRDIDRRNAPGRPIPSGRVSPRAALAFSALLLAGGNAAAWGAGPAVGAVAAALSAAYAAYGVWSKKLGFVKNLVIAATGSASLAAASACAGRLSPAVAAAGAHVFLSMLAVEVFKDREDMAGDAAEGARTWALAVGAEAAERASFAFAAGASAVLLAAGLLGATRGIHWPFAAAAAAFQLAGFLRPVPARTPVLILCGAALGVAGIVLGAPAPPGPL